MKGKPSKFSQQNEHAAERKAEGVREAEGIQEDKAKEKQRPDVNPPVKQGHRDREEV